MNKKAFITIIVISTFIFLADLYDLPGRLGYSLNFNAWSVYVVIVLFVITYFTLDNKSAQRVKNQDEIAIALIQSTYDSVSEYLEIFGSKGFYELISKKISEDEILPENSAYNSLRNAPFGFEERIYDYAKEGIVSSANIQMYNNLKQKYQNYFTSVIVFGDHPETIEKIKEDAWNAFEMAQNELKKINKQRKQTV